ncbi:MAG: hypothetical protein MJ252_20550 [archaeon]|nr:hypothetical protein [archaeon]
MSINLQYKSVKPAKAGCTSPRQVNTTNPSLTKESVSSSQFDLSQLNIYNIINKEEFLKFDLRHKMDKLKGNRESLSEHYQRLQQEMNKTNEAMFVNFLKQISLYEEELERLKLKIKNKDENLRQLKENSSAQLKEIEGYKNSIRVLENKIEDKRINEEKLNKEISIYKNQISFFKNKINNDSMMHKKYVSGPFNYSTINTLNKEYQHLSPNRGEKKEKNPVRINSPGMHKSPILNKSIEETISENNLTSFGRNDTTGEKQIIIDNINNTEISVSAINQTEDKILLSENNNNSAIINKKIGKGLSTTTKTKGGKNQILFTSTSDRKRLNPILETNYHKAKNKKISEFDYSDRKTNQKGKNKKVKPKVVGNKTNYNSLNNSYGSYNNLFKTNNLSRTSQGKQSSSIDNLFSKQGKNVSIEKPMTQRSIEKEKEDEVITEREDVKKEETLNNELKEDLTEFKEYLNNDVLDQEIEYLNNQEKRIMEALKLIEQSQEEAKIKEKEETEKHNKKETRNDKNNYKPLLSSRKEKEKNTAENKKEKQNDKEKGNKKQTENKKENPKPKEEVNKKK